MHGFGRWSARAGFRLCVCAVLSVCFALPAWAQPPNTPERVTLTAVIGQPRTGILKDLTDRHVQLADGQKVDLTNVIRVDWADHQATARETDPVLLLANGDRVFARTIEIEGEELTAAWSRFPAWPRLSLPLETVRGFLLAPPANADERTQLARRVREQTDESDVLWLTNGDRGIGDLTSLDEAAFSLDTRLGPIQMDRAGVRAVGFNPALTSFPPRKGISALLMLDDGTRLTVHNLGLQGNRLACRAGFGGDLELPLEQIISLQILGGRAVYLSDLEPANYRFIPYLSSTWPLQRDHSVSGGPLTIGARQYAKGLGMHSRTEVTYALDGAYTGFQAVAGIDQSAGNQGSVIFRVVADGRPLFQSDQLTGRSPPLPIGPLDVTGAKSLTLIVDFADFGDVQDHANWCDAFLIRQPSTR